MNYIKNSFRMAKIWAYLPCKNKKNILRNLKGTSHKVVVAISHADLSFALGGTEMAMRNEATPLISAGIDYLSVSPCQIVGDKFKDKIAVTINYKFIAHFRVNDLISAIQELDDRLMAIHLHHALHWDLAQLHNIISCRNFKVARIFIHDYYTTCKHPNLLYNDREFCGPPLASSIRCQVCRHGENRQPHIDVMSKIMLKLQSNSAKFEIAAPSATCAEIWSKTHVNLQKYLRIIPHKLFTRDAANQCVAKDAYSNTPNRKLRIAYIGYTADIKGFPEWWDTARQNEIQDIYDCYHLGAAGLHDHKIKEHPVSFVKDGPDAMIKAMKSCEIDIAILLSTVPETYSFTCAEAIEAGVYILTSKKSGNIARLVEQEDAGLVMNDNSQLRNTLLNQNHLAQTIKDWKKTRCQITAHWSTVIAQETLNLL